MGRRLTSNGSALGIASLSAANDLVTLGTSTNVQNLDDVRVKQTLHSITTVLDRIVKENAKKRKRKYNVIQIPTQFNQKNNGKKIVDLSVSKAGGADIEHNNNNVKKGSVKKISRKGIRARMDDEGEDDQQGSMQQGFVPTPKTSAGAAEINMMKQSN